MIDTHCHILPGVDDGATSLGESLAMAQLCVRDGVSHIVATPHCNRHYRLLRADILPQVTRLNDAIAGAGIPLRILPGSEIQVTDTTCFQNEFEAGLYCHFGDNRAFTLLEFGKAEQYPPDAAELMSWLLRRGTIPIIAHPERYQYFVNDPGLIGSLTDAGAWLQVTAASLLGDFGVDAQDFGKTLLRRYPNIVLATDAHNILHCTNSGLLAGYTWVREHLGETRVEELEMRARQVLAAYS